MIKELSVDLRSRNVVKQDFAQFVLSMAPGEPYRCAKDNAQLAEQIEEVFGPLKAATAVPA